MRVRLPSLSTLALSWVLEPSIGGAPELSASNDQRSRNSSSRRQASFAAPL
jgi:hypothetical protein